MTQAYSDPSRESDPHALPDIEVFYMSAAEQAATAIGNDNEVAYDVAANEGQIFANVRHMSWFLDAVTKEFDGGWFWWSCLPGCMPDGEPSGPFATEAEALGDAQDY